MVGIIRGRPNVGPTRIVLFSAAPPRSFVRSFVCSTFSHPRAHAGSSNRFVRTGRLTHSLCPRWPPLLCFVLSFAPLAAAPCCFCLSPSAALRWLLTCAPLYPRSRSIDSGGLRVLGNELGVGVFCCFLTEYEDLLIWRGLILWRRSTILMAGNNENNANESKMVVPLNTWVLISNFKVAYNLLRRPDGTFNRHLAEFLDRKVPANIKPVDGVSSSDFIIDRSTSLLSRIYQPATKTPQPGIFEIEKTSNSTVFPVIIFFHGGSFAHSSANSAIYDMLCRRLVGLCNAVVVSVNYRRSPEYRYPSAYDDGWAALKWVNSQAGLRSGEDSKVHIFLAGDSSGGNIAHHVAIRAMKSEIKILGNILLNPMFGGEKRTESEMRFDGKYFVTVQDRDWYWKAFLPEGADRDHPACNPFGPKGESLKGLPFPKSLVVVSGLDLLKDWQLAYFEGLKDAEQDVKLLYLEQATIGFYFLPNTEHFYTVMEEIKNFVSSNC